MTITEAQDSCGSVDQDLAMAAQLLRARIAAAKRAQPNSRTCDLTTAQIACDAPYAKPKRLILGDIAAAANVLATATTRLAPGNYRRGADVTLYGFRRDIKRVERLASEQIARALAAMAEPKQQPGEDIATYRESFLLGFRLGLKGTFDRDAVELAVRVIPEDAVGVQQRSTGSGAWLGYLAARDELAAAETQQEADEATAA